MSMLPFLDHVEGCKQCREHPRFPCVVGYRLWKAGEKKLLAAFESDPQRAKA